MRLLLGFFLITQPAFARTWLSRTCGRLLGERPRLASDDLRHAFERLEEEISRLNRFSGYRLNVALERADFVEDEPWALVVEEGMAFATTPGRWFAVVREDELTAMNEEALEIKRRNPGLNFEVRWQWARRLREPRLTDDQEKIVAWIEGELGEAQKTRTMLVMLQYAKETSGKKRPAK